MPHTWRSRIHAPEDSLTSALAALRNSLSLPGEFSAESISQAKSAVENHVLPDQDLTDLPFVTIDPESSLDLDQAMFLRRNGSGYTAFYAIADVPSFVDPDSVFDLEIRQRGVTYYAPDGRIPLHPTFISEDAGSLLPGVVRGAFVWTFELDGDAKVTTAVVQRARVRSRAKLNYKGVQAALDGGTADENLQLLREIGLKRAALERARGGASLNRPAQVIDRDPATGAYTLSSEVQLPVEGWNAQISLMTGMEAARLMLEAKVGIIRTMPVPDPKSLDVFERQTQVLGRPWTRTGPDAQSYGAYLATLNPVVPAELAIIHAASSLFRGAGYTAFDGSAPEERIQAAIAAPYAHATAPLRRLVDRWTLVLCEAISQGRAVPEWARTSLPLLGDLMKAADQKAGQLDRAAVDTVEAALLANHVGESFEAVVLSGSNGNSQASIQLLHPPVLARCEGELEAGTTVTVRLDKADIDSRTVEFSLIS